MGYTYEQRKRPHGPQNTAPERTNAPGPGHNALMPGTAATQNGPSFDLDGAMQARMTDTFGDLSAVRNYTPPEKSQAPVPTGPYTGPVTHAISNASPSPSVAGPMQAKRRDADAKGAKALRKAGRRINERYALPSYPGYKSLNPQVWEERTHTPGFSRHFGKRPERFKVRKKSSYLAYENAQEYSNGNNLTRLHEKPEDDLLLRDDEDSNVVSKKMLKSYQRENNAALDRMFHIRAGLLAEFNHNRGPSTAAKDRKRKEFKKEAIEKGLKGYSIEEYADDKLDEYVKQNKPKKPLQIVSKEDRDWYDFMTSYGMNEDLLNALYEKTVQTGKALVDYRKNLGKQNPTAPSNKLDFISAYSDQAREFSLYRDIRSDVNTDANSSMENHIEKLKQRKDYYENKPTVDAAEALYGAGDSSNNDFVNSEEGQSMLPAFEKKDNTANLALYGMMKTREEFAKQKKDTIANQTGSIPQNIQGRQSVMPGGFPDDLIGLLPRERNSGMSDDDLEDLADYTKERQSGLLNDSSILDQTIALDSPGVDLDDNPLPMLSGQKRKKKK